MDIISAVIFQVLTRWNICKSRLWLLCTPVHVVNILIHCFKNHTVKFMIYVSVLTCSCYQGLHFCVCSASLILLSIDEHVGLGFNRRSSMPINLGGISVAAERILMKH